MKRIILLATIILLAAVASVYAASFADTYGLSPKAMSMGNAMTAHVNDWSSVYYNIAGLGRTSHFKGKSSKSELFLGYMNTQPQTELDIPQRYEEDAGVRTNYDTNADEDLDYGELIIGAALDLNSLYKMPKTVSSARFGIAVGIGDDLKIAKVNDVEPQTHNYLRFGREAQQMMLISGVGFGFAKDAIGIGFGIKSSFGGKSRILLEEVQITEEEQKPAQQTTMDLELDMSAWVAGLYLDFSQMGAPLSFGFSFRQESRFEIDPLETPAIVEVGGIPLNFELSILDYYQPASFTYGLSYQFKRLLVAFDVENQIWSDYIVSSNQKINSASILPDLDDIWIPKIGLQYKANAKADIYFGYYYQPSFVPDKAVEGTVNWLDNDKHVASIGLSYDAGKWAGFQKPMVLHIGYQFQYLVDREVKKNSPDSLNPDYSYGGTVHTFMVGASF